VFIKKPNKTTRGALIIFRQWGAESIINHRRLSKDAFSSLFICQASSLACVRAPLFEKLPSN